LQPVVVVLDILELLLELLVQQAEPLGAFPLKRPDPAVPLAQLVSEVFDLSVVCGFVDPERNTQDSGDRSQDAEERAVLLEDLDEGVHGAGSVDRDLCS
jgi:hypothetical protein